MLRLWRPMLVAAVAVALCGCQTTGVEPPQVRHPDVAISSLLYKPTLHAIVVLNGSFGTGRTAKPLVTLWRRRSTGEMFSLVLQPKFATVQALVPGSYDLVDLKSGTSDLAGNIHLTPLTLAPGDVIYAGQLTVRTVKPASADKTRSTAAPRYRLQVGSDPAIARAGIQLNFPGQTKNLKVRLLKAAQS